MGVGKTFIANALGHVACRSGFNGLVTPDDRHHGRDRGILQKRRETVTTAASSSAE